MSGFDFGYIFDYDTDAKVMELSEKINSLDFSQSLTELRDVLEVYKLHQWPRDYVEFDDSFEVSNVKKVIGDLNIDKELKAFIGKSLGANIADYWMIQYLAMSDLNGGCFDKLFTEYNLWTKLSDKCFAQFVDSNRFLIKDFMIKRNKQAVEKFSEIINARLVNNYSRLPGVLLTIIKSKTMYFSQEFISNNIFQTMVNAYLDTYSTIEIALIQELWAFQSETLVLDEHTLSRLETMSNSMLDNTNDTNSSIFNMYVGLINDPDPDLGLCINDEIDDSGPYRKLCINKTWLDSLSDDDLLLSIISTLFVDVNGHPYIIYNTKQLAFEKSFRVTRGRKERGQTILGDQNELITITVIAVISIYLPERFENKSIENLIFDYINNGISKKYDIDGFCMTYISSDLDINTRVSLISRAIEPILNQFKLLHKYGYVNVRYMDNMSVNEFDIDDIPSFIPSKYIYIDKELGSRCVKHPAYTGYPSYFSGKFKDEMDKLNYPYKDVSTLFSKNDALLLNHILNNKNGTKGMAIRNRYTHGGTIGLSDDEHLMNYYYIILAFLIVIAKLDEEFKWIKENGISN